MSFDEDFKIILELSITTERVEEMKFFVPEWDEKVDADYDFINVTTLSIA